LEEPNVWKKNEQSPTPASPPQTPPARPRAAAPASVIGPSIQIKGDLTGQEDLVIQGRVEGEVKLKTNNVTVGREGRIRADIYGRSVYVEGEVKGHLYGEQEVVIRASGKVQGDIVSPRVVLENGSNFKGSIDMEPATPATPAAAKSAPQSVEAAPASPADTTKPSAGGASSGASSAPAAAQASKSAAPKGATGVQAASNRS
jgi:cytoskeletal protein CcmA (bactofilin family)